MKANEYQNISCKTIVNLGSLVGPDELYLSHLVNGSMGVSSEANEVLQHIQKHVFCGKPLNKEHLLDECGDVLWYLSYILTTLGFTLEDCMEYNIDKLSKRYPERISKEGL